MASLDPTTNIGKLRLRVADYGDIQYLPDSVYYATLADNDDNLQRSTVTIASYILGGLSSKTHRKLASLEVWGSENFQNYKEFLMLTIKDPAFMNVSPIPYSASGTDVHPLIQFASDWNRNFPVTQSQQLASDAQTSPNDGSLYGALGTTAYGY